MRFQAGILAMVFSVLATARPVEVVLDASKTLIQDHTVSVSLGVKLKSGKVIGRGLFDRKDFAAGVTARTLQIDEPIESCLFSWSISNQIPGETRAPQPDLMLPSSFKGVWDAKCEINSDDEIRLSTPFQLHEIEINVSDAAFAARKAKNVLASISPASSHPGETLPSWTIQTTKTSPTKSGRTSMRLLAQGDLEFEVSTYWTLETGSLVQDQKTLKGPKLEIE